jgi:hypothetical protein
VSIVAFQGDDPALGAEAVALATRWLDDPQAIDPDLVGSVLRAAARHGDRALSSVQDAARSACRTPHSRGAPAMNVRVPQAERFLRLN